MNKVIDDTNKDDLTLSKAIEKSLSDLNLDDENLDTDKTKEKDLVKEPKKEITKETKEDEEPEEEIDPEESKRAIALLRAINNPETSKEVIQLLAKQVGLDANATKEEKKEAVKSLKEIFKEALGSDLEFMSEGLYNALEKVTNQIVDAKTKDIKESLAEERSAKQKATLELAYDKVLADFDNAKDLEQEIYDLSKSIKISEGMTPEKYFRMLYFTAAAEKGLEIKKSVTSDKDNNTNTNKNPNKVEINKDKLDKARKDANSRIASERNAPDKDAEVPQPKSLKEAIAMAVKSVEAGKSK